MGLTTFASEPAPSLFIISAANAASFAGETYMISGADLAALDNATANGGMAGDGIIELSSMPPACFLTGPRIATAIGDKAVEALTIGEHVRTVDGRLVPVKWIGRETVWPHFGFAAGLEPVCIAAGALGDGLPRVDLWLSADHGMIVDNLMINAAALVNGGTIRPVPAAELPRQISYYHVETEVHDVILANGAPAETFIDYVGRQGFDNYGENLELYGMSGSSPKWTAPASRPVALCPPPSRRGWTLSRQRPTGRWH